MIYELDAGRKHENGHIQGIAILTGLTDAEIEAVSPADRNIWYARDFITAFQKLGFNCNPRFKKFDPDTPYPCMMRFKEIEKPNGYWYSEIYYNRWIYYGDHERCSLSAWINQMKGKYKITSMLQVWI